MTAFDISFQNKSNSFIIFPSSFHYFQKCAAKTPSCSTTAATWAATATATTATLTPPWSASRRFTLASFATAWMASSSWRAPEVTVSARSSVHARPRRPCTRCPSPRRCHTSARRCSSERGEHLIISISISISISIIFFPVISLSLHNLLLNFYLYFSIHTFSVISKILLF